jgi:hypothetical protein
MDEQLKLSTLQSVTASGPSPEALPAATQQAPPVATFATQAIYQPPPGFALDQQGVLVAEYAFTGRTSFDREDGHSAGIDGAVMT